MNVRSFHPLGFPDIRFILKDRTTGKNITFATNNYKKFDSTITEKTQLDPYNIEYIQPRYTKTKEQKKTRTKSKAEVFTASWLCNKMVNYCDEEWFGRKNVFNKEEDKSWIMNLNKIEFNNPNDWEKYVNSTRLEITCGEAPFIVSRYDTSTGETIPIEKRIGILDRKLRVVGENTSNKKDWLKGTYKAFQSVYGYEFQGDNLLIARWNLVMSFIEYYKDRWRWEPNSSEIFKVLDIITWNFWQMNGLTDNIPFTEIPAKICDWKNNSTLDFCSLKNIERSC